MDSTREGLKSIGKVAVMPLVRGIGLVWLDDGEFDCRVNSDCCDAVGPKDCNMNPPEEQMFY